jgi:hypothetical protein
MAIQAPRLPDQTVLLTVPFPMSGSDKPMLWQAVDDLHFRLAGGALKTPNAQGGPVQSGTPGSARRILADLSLGVSPEPTGTARQLSVVRRALRAWHVERIVVDGPSRDPVYASGFLTAALGTAPSYDHGAWVWVIGRGPTAAPVRGVSLATCRATAPRSVTRVGHHALAMAHCVLHGAST